MPKVRRITDAIYIAFKEKMKTKKYRKPRVKTQLKILEQLHCWLKKLKRWNARKELVDLANEKIEHHERYLEIAIAREVGNDAGTVARSAITRA